MTHVPPLTGPNNAIQVTTASQGCEHVGDCRSLSRGKGVALLGV